MLEEGTVKLQTSIMSGTMKSSGTPQTQQDERHHNQNLQATRYRREGVGCLHFAELPEGNHWQPDLGNS